MPKRVELSMILLVALALCACGADITSGPDPAPAVSVGSMAQAQAMPTPGPRATATMRTPPATPTATATATPMGAPCPDQAHAYWQSLNWGQVVRGVVALQCLPADPDTRRCISAITYAIEGPHGFEPVGQASAADSFIVNLDSTAYPNGTPFITCTPLDAEGEPRSRPVAVRVFINN